VPRRCIYGRPGSNKSIELNDWFQGAEG